MADNTHKDDADAVTDDTEAPEQTEHSGTPEAEGRDAESEDVKRLNLEWKAKAERANALEAENAELKKRLEQPPVAQDDKNGDGDEDYWTEIEGFAAKGDPVAKGLIAQRERETKLLNALSRQEELDEIEDKAERKEVREHFIKNRSRLGDIAAARAEVREKKLATEVAELRKRLEQATVKADPDTVRTDAREVSAKEAKARQMTKAEWDDRQARLSDSDRMKEQNLRRERRIVIKG